VQTLHRRGDKNSDIDIEYFNRIMSKIVMLFQAMIFFFFVELKKKMFCRH